MQFLPPPRIKSPSKKGTSAGGGSRSLRKWRKKSAAMGSGCKKSVSSTSCFAGAAIGETKMDGVARNVVSKDEEGKKSKFAPS